MAHDKQHSGSPSIPRWVAWTCIATVLLVGTLQATHIHKEWSNPSGSQHSFQVENGKDAQCVFCLTSHVASDIPGPTSFEVVVTASAETEPEHSHAAAQSPTWAHFIRPPPTV